VAKIRLRPMREEELPAHIERTRAEYARDIEAHGGLDRAEAEDKARRDVDAAFPGGRPAKGHSLRVIETLASGEPIGRLHYAERPPGSGKAWLYDIAIDEQMRGHGLGREAMLVFEDELRQAGFQQIGLNVFGGNEAARSLYRSLGYREAAVEMTKDMRDSDTG
jgi:ribosomal protein S18 acetylase RimI-like enzyme